MGLADFSFLHPDQELHPEKHVVGRIYYPAAPGPSGWWRWPVPWLPGARWAWGFVLALLPASGAGAGVRGALLRLSLMALMLALGNTAFLPATSGAPLGTAVDEEDEQSKDNARAAGASPVRAPSPGLSLAPGRMPVCLLSHGYWGNRTLSSSLACELASQGYLVLAVEHADGTSSMTHLAPGIRAATLPGYVDGGRWMRCSDCGTAEDQAYRTWWRLKELLTAHALLSALNQGLDVDGLCIQGLAPAKAGTPAQPPPSGAAADHAFVSACLSAPAAGRRAGRPTTASWLAGRLDTSRVAVAGHSWGGVTAALAASEHPQFCAAVALDPAWGLVPADCVALSGGSWRTRSPLLVIGSEDWNAVPDAQGELPCHRTNRDKALAASAAGGGSLMLVPKGTSHNHFDDILLFFADLIKPVLRAFGFAADGTDPKRTTYKTHRAALCFLETHLRQLCGEGATGVPWAPELLQPYLDLYGADLHSHVLTLPRPPAA